MKTLESNHSGPIAYHDHGRGQPIICLHGWGANGAFFEAQWRELQDRYRLVVPDLRGHGQSSPFSQGQRFGSLADDVAQLIASEGLKSAIIVGWSMGAMVAWDLLARCAPANVAGLVTIDMVPRLRPDSGWTFGLQAAAEGVDFDRALSAMQRDWTAYTEGFLRKTVAEGESAASIPDFTELKEHAVSNEPSSMARLWRELTTMDLRAEIASISVPTLVCYGARSQLYAPEASEWIAQQMQCARTVRFEQSGHAPHLEQTSLFNHTLDEFARANSSASDPAYPGNDPCPSQ